MNWKKPMHETIERKEKPLEGSPVNETVEKKNRRKQWTRVFTIMACVVVFATTYGLILPALTIEQDKAEEMPGLEYETAFEMAKDGDLLRIVPEGGKEGRIAVVVETDTDSENDASVLVLENDPEAGVQITEVALDDPAVSVLTPEEAAQMEGLEEEVLSLVQVAEEEGILEQEELEELGEGLEESLEDLGVNTDVILSEVKGLEEDSSAAPQNDRDAAAENDKDEQPAAGIDAGTGPEEDFTVQKQDTSVQEDAALSEVKALPASANAAEDSLAAGSSGIIDSVLQILYTVTNEDEFVANGADCQISTNALTADGQTCRITVTYDDAAEIPEGTKLWAEEIEWGSEEYLQYLGRTWTEVNKAYSEKKDRGDSSEGSYINVNVARFFDIKLNYAGEEIEPKAPVQVEISYEDGLASWDGTKPGVVHFKQDNEIEILEEVESDVEDDTVVSFRYEQDSFSVIGTYIQQETHDAETPPRSAQTASSRAAVPVRSAGPNDKDISENPEDNFVLAAPPMEPKAAGEGESSYTDDNSGLPYPTGNKTLVPNDDGTYTLTLSVKGSSQTTIQKVQKKANVLFVMDRSSSMITNTVDDTEKFWYYGTQNTAEFRGDITPANGYQFYGEINGEIVELNATVLDWTAGGDGWSTFRFTYNGVEYDHDSPLYVRSKTTRLYAEQEALNDVTSRLLAYNTTETLDEIEIAVISFADHRADTKGWTDTEYTSWAQGTDNSGFMNAVNSTRYASGTNWEEALKYAEEVISAKKAVDGDNEDYYVVFLTDGEPTNKVGDTSAAQHTGDDGNKDAYDAAKDDALKLVTNGYTFYNIFTYRKNEPVKYSKYLTNYAYSNGTDDYDDSDTEAVTTYFSDAQTIDALNETFNNIFLTIADVIGHANVSITDTLTTDAMTTTVVQGKTNGYVYTVKDPSGTVLYTVTASGDTSNPTVTFSVPASATQTYTATATDVGGKKLYSVTTAEGQEYRIALADINDTTGELTWDLSPVGVVMNDCEYSVSFVVWPDQNAYDYVAALNNGLEGYEWNDSIAVDSGKGYKTGGVSQYPSIVKYPDGTYAVLTNTDQKIHYSVVEMETINGEPNGEPTINGPYYQDLQLPDPMPLTASQSRLEKVWNVERDPGSLAEILYDTSGEPKEFSINYKVYRGTETAPYTTIKLGWDDQQGKYVWDADSVRTVTYFGHPVEVGTSWADDFSIATGLMLSASRMDELGLDKTAYPSGTWEGTTYYILEPGHDYRVEEIVPEGEDSWITYEFDFVSPIFHPMLIDGVLQSVNFTGYDETHTGAYSGDEITFTSITEENGGMDSLKVENTLRGYINLEKVVVDKDGLTPIEDDTKFMYEVELLNSTQPGPFAVEGSNIPWYGINGLFYHDQNFNYYQAKTNTESHKAHRFSLRVESGEVFEAWCSDEDGVESPENVEFDEDIPGPTWVTYNDGTGNKTIQLFGNQMEHFSDNYVYASMPLNRNEKLSVSNVPVGTEYTITETQEQGYDLVSILKEIRNGSAVESSSLNSGNTTITGTIVSDRDNHITYTNKVHSADLTVKKVDENGQPLPGAVFTLKDGNNSPVEGSANNGTYRFDDLADGSYTLEETTPPVGYESLSNAIGFIVSDGAIQIDGTLPDGVIWDDKTMTFTVRNTPQTNQITVRKQWLDYMGNADDYDGTLDLTLKQWVPGDPPMHTVTFYFRCIGNGHGGVDFPGQITSITDRSGTGVGDVTIRWDWNRYTQVQPFDVDGLGESTYTTSSSNDGVEYQSDGRGKRQTLTIHNVNRDLIIYILIRNSNYDGTNSNLIYQPTFDGVSSEIVEDELTGGTKTISLGTDGVWSQQFALSGDGRLSNSSTSLPATYNGKPCHYTIAEESVPEGYTLQQISNEPVQSGVLTAYNRRNTVDLSVVKVDEKNTTTRLNGATFVLRQIDPAKTGSMDTRTLEGGRTETKITAGEGNQTGTLSFDSLGPGYYEIKETAAPQGYNFNEDTVIYIRVTETDVQMLVKDESKAAEQWAATVRTSNATFQNTTATIINTPGAELPHTGGPGTEAYLALGALMAFGAGAVLIRRKLKRQ